MTAEPREVGRLFENAHHFSIDKLEYTANIVNSYGPERMDDVGTIAKWLTTTNHWLFHYEVCSRITPGTGRWFLEGEEFQAWLSALAPSALWVTGMPGAGKTGLASIVVEHIHQLFLDGTEAAISFAYCHYVARCTSRNLICSFIRQFLEALPFDVRPVLQPIYMRHELRQACLKEGDAIQVLRNILCLFKTPAICIVDGLDEMLDEERDKTLMHLSTLPIKLLIFSRPMNIFLERLPSARCIEMKANGADVEHFVQESLKSSSRLQTLLKGQNEVEQKIPFTIREKSGGMFLIAVLQIEALKRCMNMDALQRALDSVPSGINKMYQNTLERIDAQTTEEASVAKRVLLWLVHAKRQLTVSELQDALATSYTNSIFNQSAVINVDIILSICYGLVTIKPAPKATPQGEPRIALIHCTADSFLRDEHSSFTGYPAVTTLTCTTYLLHYRDNLLAVLKRARGDNPADIWLLDEFLASRPFLRYAYQYWGTHARDLELDAESTRSATLATIHRFLLTFGELMELEATELPPQVDHDSGFSTQCSFHYAGLLNPAHIAARHGLVGLWPLVRQYGWELMRGMLRWTALHFAAYHNEVEMVKCLLQDLPASIVNWRDMDNRTALAIAVSRSNDVVVRVLLAHHAVTVDIVALGTAVRGGNEAVVELLLPKVRDPAVPIDALNWLLPGGRRMRPLESLASIMKMPAAVQPGTRTTMEWSSQTVWLENLGRYNPSGMIDILFQHAGVDIDDPQWLGLIQRGERGLDVILAILRHRALDINVFFARAMVGENQRYNAKFLLWHPPFSMAIAAHPRFDVDAALKTARDCAQCDVAESLVQPPFANKAVVNPRPSGDFLEDVLGDDEEGSLGPEVDGDRNRLVRGIVEEHVKRFIEEHTSGPPQREVIFYDRRIDPAC